MSTLEQVVISWDFQMFLSPVKTALAFPIRVYVNLVCECVSLFQGYSIQRQRFFNHCMDLQCLSLLWVDVEAKLSCEGV